MSIFFILVLVLFALAIGDLIVGVSNDAVNFLNSAIGSRVAPRHVIMIVASVGIVLGATFSDGLMEVARKGIFNPDMFTFADVMILFTAVMVTDIMLLDLFNSLSLPTSTTVSIVFELLGASLALGALKVFQAGGGFGEIITFVNADSALFIILGIFLSVGVAFLVGALVQFISRLLFSFRVGRRQGLAGILWSAAALTALCFFLIIKGLKGASFVPDDIAALVEGASLWLIPVLLVVLTGVMALLQRTGVNVLNVVVLFGTFSLAFAFAGNDLVNFIGVPIAGLASWQTWAGSGADPSSMMMTSLLEPVNSNTWLLIAAGTIMAATLWKSRKARTVTRTEVELARQHEGFERFEPNALSRGVVRIAGMLSTAATRLLPNAWIERIRLRMKPFEVTIGESGVERPAFDLVRASVNLATASALIAVATSMRLPLSTTYVSFMVAMGTSMADGAWSAADAPHRVAGVLVVIGGWFLTAVVAMIVAGLLAIIMKTLGAVGLAAVIMIAIGALWYGASVHGKGEKKRERREAVSGRSVTTD